jgi:hypothetical protein
MTHQPGALDYGCSKFRAMSNVVGPDCIFSSAYINILPHPNEMKYCMKGAFRAAYQRLQYDEILRRGHFAGGEPP